MRIYQKKEIIHVMCTLGNYIDELKNLIESYEEEKTRNLLEYIQNAVITVGNTIEQIEGMGTGAVSFLEQLCEWIYQCSVAEGVQNKLKYCKKIRQITIKIIDNIKYHIPDDKYIAVFLPYKASMWDSLESIWMAARDDDNCVTYVVPIPYFDKNPDGSFSQMHYEGEELPEYVPVTNWQTFQLEQERPDVIYFHNPYDQYNYVTSVHPNFYSSELKKYTDMLIYIPYFVSMGDVPEHFCSTIGVFNANKVIVQSELVMNTYKRIYIETLGAQEKEKEEKTGIHNMQYWDKLQKIADEKFLALGSPKFDKVHNTSRDNAEKTLPIEWYNKIYFTDNKGKKWRNKVVLYNTSIQALLDNKDKAIDKLRYVFDAFKQRKDVVLWWRPHPLNQSTMQSMVLELVDEYSLLVKEYKEANFGVYDDTADMNRAIAVSDAYFGDYGSIPVLYIETGKPILIQNYEITEDVL